MALVKVLKCVGRPGDSWECQVFYIASNGTVTQLDHADGEFRAVAATPKVPLVEFSSSGLFTRAESRTAWADGRYVLMGNKVGVSFPDSAVEFDMRSDVEISHPTPAEILAATVEGSLTLKAVLRIFLAALAGKVTGGGTTTVHFRDNADAKDRITATVAAGGNRSAVTLDGSD